MARGLPRDEQSQSESGPPYAKRRGSRSSHSVLIRPSLPTCMGLPGKSPFFGELSRQETSEDRRPFRLRSA